MSTRSHSTRHATIHSTAVAGVLLVAFVAGACMPGASTPVPTPGATSAVRPTPDVAVSGPTALPPTVVQSAAPRPADPVATVTPPAVSASPAATAPPQLAEAEPEPFDMNLYRSGDFVAQYTFEWCVGASLQMAINMATDQSRTSRADQQDLWELARDLSNSPFGGANPRGWTAALNDLGVGPYVLVSLPSFEEAVNVAARAIRDTNRPVGLVMWRGRHAWVMSGFEATADPSRHDEFDVTGIRVLDPLFPHGSDVWGPSPRPNTLITPARLAERFVMRDSRRVNLGVSPGWLLILPTTTEA